MEKQIKGLTHNVTFTAEQYLKNLAQARAEGKKDAEKVAIAVCDKCSIRKETLKKEKGLLKILLSCDDLTCYPCRERIEQRLKSLEQSQIKHITNKR